MIQADFAIVGGGLGGSALGGALAAAGASVIILERETTFRDRVRGEWMAPWGVEELQRLGLYDRFIAAGGHHVSRQIAYDELSPPAEAERRAIPLAEVHPTVPGPLCMEHVAMQNEALAAAQDCGATVYRGVAGVSVGAGASPRVRCVHPGGDIDLRCSLVVGADGRGSLVRRQLGLALEMYPATNLIAGLLIEGAAGWPEHIQALGKAGDIHYLVFPQGGGRVRLYAEYAADQRGRFSGAEGQQEMLRAFDLPFLPNSRTLVEATPIGPCRSMPSQSSIVDPPYTEGAVLIGDAAGYNDPITGQGLSITLRDARMVADILCASDRRTVGEFEPYAEERRERMRRLRGAAEFLTALNASFEPEDLRRRQRAFAKIGERPQRLSGVLSALYTGPETAPAEVLTDAYRESLFGTA